jgi:hypothetical protein
VFYSRPTRIIAVNDHVIRAIESAHAKAGERSLLPWRRPPPVEEAIVEHFETAMTVLSEQLSRLVLEAEATLGDLQALEERLDALQDIAKREDSSVQTVRDELLADLWTRIGLNKKEMLALERNEKTLRDLTTYRTAARAHVIGALQTLQSMGAEIEDLRERAATPSLADGRVPADVHIRSIQNGIERLRDSQIRAQDNRKKIVENIVGGPKVGRTVDS